MSFKHGKFEDSVTMRSLEKVAQERGLVKNEGLTKKASAETKSLDLRATSDLMKNILTLSAGLRQSGFDKYAEELEQKYFVYKQSQTLYETSKEKGEDLIDAAHPKGSHKLENVDSDESLVETVIDQHLKNLQMINKKPTGKLSEASNIIKAVKIVLADVPGFTTEKEKIEAREYWAIESVKKAIPDINNAKYLNEKTISVKAHKLAFDKKADVVIAALNKIIESGFDIGLVSAARGLLVDLTKVYDLALGSGWGDVIEKGVLLSNPITAPYEASKALYEGGADLYQKIEQEPGEANREKAVTNIVWQAWNKIETASKFWSGIWDKWIEEQTIKKNEADLQKKKIDDAANALAAGFQKEADNLRNWAYQIATKYADKKYNELIKQLLANVTWINGLEKTQDNLSKVQNINLQTYNNLVQAKLIS